MQSPSANAAPVCFEIDLNKNATVAPPVKERLEQHVREPLTRAQLQEKLERAKARKAQQLASQVEQVREISDKVGVIQERKSSIERAQGARIIEQMDRKMTTAEANRTSKLESVQAKARHYNERVLLIRERRSSQERAEEERVITQIASKMTGAEERQAEKINSIQEKAKQHNERVAGMRTALAEEERRDKDEKAAALEGKAQRVSSVTVSAQEKARAHNQRVQAKKEQVDSVTQEAADSLMAKVAAKLNQAATRRDANIEQVKTTAAQSAVPRGSTGQATAASAQASASAQEQ